MKAYRFPDKLTGRSFLQALCNINSLQSIKTVAGSAPFGANTGACLWNWTQSDTSKGKVAIHTFIKGLFYKNAILALCN